MNIFKIIPLTLLLSLGLLSNAVSRENPWHKAKSSLRAKAAACSPAQTQTQFFINNVRTSAETGGNTWYDRGNGLPFYEVPAREGNHAIFAGALWMGGIDPAGNLKLAAIRFRQLGNDFWPGPLTVDGTASTEAEVCAFWDQFFLMSRQMVETHRFYFTLLAQGLDPLQDPIFENGYSIPQAILDWPASGDVSLGQSATIAPFVDFIDPVTEEMVGTANLYEPEIGDYPLYDLDQEIDCRTRLVTDPVPLFGDFTMYWVFNDKGNVHTETQGEPIGMEIQAQMFGFATNDEINNMTFCNYVLINRGTLTLENTYFAQWVDTDLGNSQDDFVGCDVMRGLGYSYNGDNNDESSTSGPGYGIQPPAIGVDFFEGPYQDSDGINNAYGIGEGEALNGLGYLNPLDSLTANGIDSIIDNERFGMRRFLFHNNSQGSTGDPTFAVEYYNLMRSIWITGQDMIFGGTGFNQSGLGLPADFMFPGDTDPLHWGTNGIDPNYGIPGGWTEENEGNAPQDRRFVQSAGPFTLDPGEFNNITVGVVYARAATGGPFASVELLRQADDKAQSLFENCFRLLEGPNAPDLTAQELDKEIILYLRNTSPFSNNLGELYTELDPTIPPFDTTGAANDQLYRFQGYQVFQLKNSGVSVSDIENPELSRLVFQSDLEDFEEQGSPIGQIINYEFDPQIGLPVPTEKVNGTNEGIKHSIRLTNDQFASGDTRLVNFKKYYYVAVAYGYNNYQEYNPNPAQLSGQAFPYLRGRSGPSGDIQPITVIPHKPVPEQFGTVFTAQYGDGVQITRLEGAGNGGNVLTPNASSIEAIIAPPVYKADEITYLPGEGPINVKIVDPLNVKPAKFKLSFYNELLPEGGYTGEFNDSRWFMIDQNNPVDTIFSENTIRIANEQIVPEYGISVEIGQYTYPRVEFVANGELVFYEYPEVVSSGIEFPSEPNGWLTGISDQDGLTNLNWIRSGIIKEDMATGTAPCFFLDDGTVDEFYFNDYENVDNDQFYETIIDGTLAPARLGAYSDCGVGPLNETARLALSQDVFGVSSLTFINSVEIYVTPDKSKWSRVPVFEMQPVTALAQMQKEKMTLRGALSVDKNGRNQLDPQANIEECTLNGAQAYTAEYINGLPSFFRDNLLAAVNAEYPSITTADDLIGLSFGMGWFPGYAIDPEKGERHNMAFGENSYFAADNGRDMLWNPSARVGTFQGDLVVGGEHYVYTFLNQQARFPNSADLIPSYDQGQTAYERLISTNAARRVRVYAALEWIYFPRSTGAVPYNSPEEGLVPGEVKLSAKLAKPYRPYATAADELGEASFPFVDPTTNYGISDNFWYPSYEFTTDGRETAVNVTSAAKTALDLIDVVPNPYYAYSAYEQSRVDNRVKFVNLPPECKIQIFTINGTLIRVLEKDNPDTFLEWNLQNEFFIPISGGLYLIHLQSPDLGERVLKFFAATRPTDLRNF